MSNNAAIICKDSAANCGSCCLHQTCSWPPALHELAMLLHGVFIQQHLGEAVSWLIRRLGSSAAALCLSQSHHKSDGICSSCTAWFNSLKRVTLIVSAPPQFGGALLDIGQHSTTNPFDLVICIH